MEMRVAVPLTPVISGTRRFVAQRLSFFSTFFTLDHSPDNYAVIDIQRRACWISLALVLQALNEGLALWHGQGMPKIWPWLSTITFVLILGSFVMMWQAFRPSTLKKQARRVSKHPQVWQCLVLILVLLTSIVGVIELYRAIDLCFFEAPQYSNDGTSLDTNAAIVLLEGKDPYAVTNIAS